MRVNRKTTRQVQGGNRAGSSRRWVCSTRLRQHIVPNRSRFRLDLAQTIPLPIRYEPCSQSRLRASGFSQLGRICIKLHSTPQLIQPTHETIKSSLGKRHIRCGCQAAVAENSACHAQGRDGTILCYRKTGYSAKSGRFQVKITTNNRT